MYDAMKKNIEVVCEYSAIEDQVYMCSEID